MQILKVNKLTPTELTQIANLHFHILNESFLNNFGLEFLKIVYQQIIKDPQNTILVLKKDQQVKGFLVGTTNGAIFNQNIIKNKFYLLLKEILKNSIKNPFLILRILQWRLFTSANKYDDPELKLIAIDNSLQGQGWGTKLVKEFDKIIKKKNFDHFLVGTKSNNTNSNNFYKKLKFHFQFSTKTFGDEFNYYSSKPIKTTATTRPNYLIILSILTLIISAVIFVYQANVTMATVPFYDFDEAHRAENAKRMAEYHEYFVPLTGSSFDRVNNLRIPFKENHFNFIYYHLERPFLVYLTMVLSTHFFGPSEWSYRIPSFLFGMGNFLVLIYFAQKMTKKVNYLALMVALLGLITSSDLWLSSEYAQMDTGITFFLTLSLMSLMYYTQVRYRNYLYLSGVTFALGILSKGQPAIIFIFPLAFLLLTKKLTFKELGLFVLSAALLIIPWIGYLGFRFGLYNLVNIFSSFAISSASIQYSHQIAPVFWYVRWWWESFRPGWSLFLALLLWQIKTKQLNLSKLTILTFIFGGLLAFSIPINKIWWYVLPLLPAISFYLYLAVRDYLEKEKKLFNLTIAILLSSLPVFLQTTNTFGLIYGFTTVILTFLILIAPAFKKFQFRYLFLATLIFSLYCFYVRFPAIVPWHWNTKPASLYYKSLGGIKCLWVYDMPSEAALFYSDTGEIKEYNKDTIFPNHCQNYVLTPVDIPDYLKYQSIVFQKGHMKLLKI